MRTYPWLAMVFGVIAVVALTPATTTAVEIRKFRSGPWSVGVYTNDQSKNFSHCAAHATYNSGIAMFVSVRDNYSWAVGFSHPSWNLQIGSKIDLSFTFDNLAPWTGKAGVIDKSLVLVEMSDNNRLIEQFRLAYKLTVNAEGRTYGFNLDGTARLIPDLVQCVRTEVARERGEPLPPIASAPPPAPRAPQPSPPQSNANELAAMRLATNLLLQARFPNAQIIPTSEAPSYIKGNGVAWRADGLFGSVGVYNKSVAKDAQTAGTILLEGDIKSCKGDLATSRSSDLVDGKIITKAVSVCKISSGVLTNRYFIFDGDEIGWVVYVLADMATDSVSRPTPMADSEFQNVAVRSLSAR